jgi:hypothetical protein
MVYVGTEFLHRTRCLLFGWFPVLLARHGPPLLADADDDGVGSSVNDRLHGAVGGSGHGDALGESLGGDARLNRQDDHSEDRGMTGIHLPLAERRDVESRRKSLWIGIGDGSLNLLEARPGFVGDSTGDTDGLAAASTAGGLC